MATGRPFGRAATSASEESDDESSAESVASLPACCVDAVATVLFDGTTLAVTAFRAAVSCAPQATSIRATDASRVSPTPRAIVAPIPRPPGRSNVLRLSRASQLTASA